MTFDENSITDIVMDISGETQEIVGNAADKLTKAMFEKQSADVDAVTGATLTSDGVKEAAAKCIAQAKGVPYEALTGNVAEWKEVEFPGSDMNSPILFIPFTKDSVFFDYTNAVQNAQLLNTFPDIEFGYQDATFDSQWHYK